MLLTNDKYKKEIETATKAKTHLDEIKNSRNEFKDAGKKTTGIDNN